MDDVAESVSWWRRPVVLAAVLAAIAAVAIALLLIARGPAAELPGAADLDLFRGSAGTAFHIEAASTPDPDFRTELVAIDPASGEIEWTADLPASVSGLGFSDNGISFSYSGQWRGGGGFGSLTFAGEPKWQLESATDARYDTELLDDGDILISTRTTFASPAAEVMRIDANTGDLLWRTKVDHFLSTYALLNGRLIGLQERQGLLGMDLATGEILWEAEFENKDWHLGPSLPVRTYDNTNSDAAYFEVVDESQNAVLGVTANGDVLTEFDVEAQPTVVLATDEYVIVDTVPFISRFTPTGELEWQRSGYAAWEFEAIDQTGLITTQNARATVGIDLATGDRLWRTEEEAGANHVAAGNDAYYILHGDDLSLDLWAIDAESGSIRWSTPFGGLVRQAPVVIDDTVIVGVAGSYTVPGRVDADPAVRGALQGLEVEGGTLAWSVELSGGFEHMEEHKGVLYVVSFPNRADS